ncbi:MAG: DUF2769 domain-containing protein [Candidatus Bathyarchaeota archaeon]|nr:MAG: DUF2769 domain-containing protein [Candidatus Bathyarchaeota archaeon]
MDKFEKAMQQIAQMTEEDRMKMIESKKKLCICGECSTYNDCARENKELLYCALGKSPTCITDENGCICRSCPLIEQMGLEHEYFCTRDSERGQRGI